MSNMNKDVIPEGFTIKLALVDLFPVLFFSLAAILLGMTSGDVIVMVGAGISLLSGVGKVFWKLIVVLKKKNVWPLFVQMRVLLPIGFMIALAGVVLDVINNTGNIALGMAEFPAWLFLMLGGMGLVAMIICAVKLDSSDVRANWIEQGINSVAQLCILIAAVFTYLNAIYPASIDMDKLVLDLDKGIHMTIEKGELIAFEPEEPVAGLIIYPGAKVECEAYAPLVKSCAEKGILSVVVHMPYELSMLNMDAAQDIMNKYPQIDKWYLGGHSLGGVMASAFAADNTEKLTGMIYLASYSSNDLSESKLRILSLYGSEDKVLGMNGYQKAKTNYPDDFKEVIIEGGNHAGFAYYGPQNGDGEAAISVDKQIESSAELISDFIKK